MRQDRTIKDPQLLKDLLAEVLYQYKPLYEASSDSIGTFKAIDKFGSIYLVHLFGEPMEDDKERFWYKRRTELKFKYEDAVRESGFAVKDQSNTLPDGTKRKRLT